MEKRWAKPFAALLVLSIATLAMSACGGSDEGEATGATLGSAEESTSETSEPPAETTTTAEASDEPESDDVEAPAEPGASGLRTVLTMAPASAGPITVTPTLCSIEGTDLAGPSGVESLAFAGDRAFIANENGVMAFSFTGGGDCVLTVDPTVGAAGVMTDDDVFDSISGSPSGRLVASGVLGSMVYDTIDGLSYACDDMTGVVALSADGALALMNFPGREAVERWELTDSICNEVDALAFPELLDVKFVGFDGNDLLVGGEDPTEVVTLSRYRDGVVSWTAGTGEIGAPGWFGWVHGAAPCGSFTCVIDTNTDQLALIDAGGAVVASFDFADLVGERGWIEPIVVGPDGAVYVLFDEAVDDDEGIRTYFGSVIRLEVTG